MLVEIIGQASVAKAADGLHRNIGVLMARLASILFGVAALAVVQVSAAVEVNVVGLFACKAMLEINKAPARIVNVGQTIQGIKLIEANSYGALVEINGKREHLNMGQSVASGGPASDKPRAILTADGNGHLSPQAG